MKIRDVADAIKFEHTIFALPFAYLGSWIGSGGLPAWSTLGWVTLCMVMARSAGMAVNRWVDLPIDRENPRAAKWPTVTGAVSARVLGILTIGCSLLFFFAAAQLNPLCLKASPLALFLLIFYPYTKRFTWTCHFWLGAVLAAAPVGGWLAVTGQWHPGIVPIMLAVWFWVAGFDMLYALLDLDFDKGAKVRSVPQQFGLQGALILSAFCHGVAIACFIWFGAALQLGVWYWIGCALVSGLLIYEHVLVTPNRLDRINQAFFTINGWISVILFVFTVLDLR